MNERRYEITIDRITFNDDATHIRLLDSLAASSGADFTDIAVTDDSSAITVTLAFNASSGDLRRYADYYDADLDIFSVA